ncbi:MAG TPA: hypothetical protein VMU41_09880 [Candidatus Binataceae bacterium]|nr:hypothetical protein [Candidatus Binataceae bacterium]
MGDDAKPQSWWQTLPGILTSVTAAITAIAGLLAVIHQLSAGSAPANPTQAVSASSPQAQVTPAQVPSAAAAASATAATNSAERKVLPGRFADRCGCWGAIKIGTTHPDLRCQSGLAVARKCGEMTCPNGYASWHYQCE